MEALKSYLYTAMLAALVSSVIIRISEPRYRTYIRFCAGLCLLLTLTAPLIRLTSEGLLDRLEAPPISQVEEEHPYMGAIGEGMSNRIGDFVADRYGIPREKIQVKLTLDLTDLSAISLMEVELTIEHPCNQEIICEDLTNALNCPTEVIVLHGNTDE